MTLQTRLTSSRKAKELTQEELAIKVSVSRAAIGHYETGQREPTLDTLVALSDVLGVSTDYLLKGSDE